MFTFLTFLVRNPAINEAEFWRHYEESHVPLALKTFPQILEHRRFYATEGGAMFPPNIDQQWDAVVAITMANRQGFDDMLAFLADRDASREIVADGEVFLDHSRCGMLVVDQQITRREQ